ncbi:glycosyltransferase family 2 protein [Vulcanisaeta thermophila]|uniref:glycosyltransferase family 2 protein n=1 Tax=Vulcanisaeta thermophila TaxID=867917 RepID=UPI0008529991|nr:glycosyltransferase [Vulcanisaeta thermophila]
MRVTALILTSGSKDRIPYIEVLIKSIAKQTVKPHEVVVATETSGNLINDLLRKYVPDIEHKVIETGYWNKCLTANKAILRSSGDVVFLLEDDLYLTPNFIEEVLKTFREYPSTACVYTNCIWVFPEGAGTRGNGIVSDLARVLRKLTIHNSALPRFVRKISDHLIEVPVFTMSVACKKEVLLRVGLYDMNVNEPILGEDYDLALRIVKAGYKIIQNTKAVSYHFTKQVSKGVRRYGEKPRALMGTYASEVYFMTKNRDLLGTGNVIMHMVYRIIESVAWGIRARNPLLLIYGPAGSLMGFIKGIAYKYKN